MRQAILLLFSMLFMALPAAAQERENAALTTNQWWQPIFKPLTADPQWPRLYASYYKHNTNQTLNNSFEPVIGASLAIVSGKYSNGMTWDFGIQSSFTSQFDMNTPSYDQITMDYIFAIPYTIQWRNLAVMLRVYHLSSHLGDEFLMKQKPVRENLSYEVINLLVSYEPYEWLRVYGGLAYIPVPEPKDYGYFTYQLGAELYLQPTLKHIPDTIIALDMKGIRPHNYEPSLSLRAHFKVVRNFYITMVGYRGFSQNGQFFRDTDTYYGIALSFF